METVRLTQFARGGGCACKIPAGELEQIVEGLQGVLPRPAAEVLVGLDDGDDAAAVRIQGGVAVLSTADFFTPVIDDAYDFGRIAAANALSDVYAMGGTPVMAINLVVWPRESLPAELLAEVLRGGLDVAAQADCPVLGGHSIDGPEPVYGMAVTGTGDPEQLMRNDAAQPGLPISLTKPLGVGVLNNRHKATGEVSQEAVASMTALNREAARAAVGAGVRAATDVTGFGLLGHLYKMCRASGVAARVDAAAVPYVAGAREALAAELLAEVLRGGLDVAAQADCPVLGGHSIDGPEPVYGMAVTGTGDPEQLMRNDAARPGLPISLTKPLGVGVLNNRHKATGEVSQEAVESMTALNREAALAAVGAGVRAATDVTGFGLLGHLFKMCRASGVAARVDAAAVPYVAGAREALAAGHVPGGSRRNLDWVRPHLSAAPGIDEDELILLADAQTSGGLLVVGEIPGAPVVGETVAAGTLGQGVLVAVA